MQANATVPTNPLPPCSAREGYRILRALNNKRLGTQLWAFNEQGFPVRPTPELLITETAKRGMVASIRVTTYRPRRGEWVPQKRVICSYPVSKLLASQYEGALRIMAARWYMPIAEKTPFLPPTDKGTLAFYKRLLEAVGRLAPERLKCTLAAKPAYRRLRAEFLFAPRYLTPDQPEREYAWRLQFVRSYSAFLYYAAPIRFAQFEGHYVRGSKPKDFFVQAVANGLPPVKMLATLGLRPPTIRLVQLLKPHLQEAAALLPLQELEDLSSIIPELRNCKRLVETLLQYAPKSQAGLQEWRDVIKFQIINFTTLNYMAVHTRDALIRCLRRKRLSKRNHHLAFTLRRIRFNVSLLLWLAKKLSVPPSKRGLYPRHSSKLSTLRKHIRDRANSQLILPPSPKEVESARLNNRQPHPESFEHWAEALERQYSEVPRDLVFDYGMAERWEAEQAALVEAPRNAGPEAYTPPPVDTSPLVFADKPFASSFEDSGYVFKRLETYDAFLQEGKDMDHCVGWNDHYYLQARNHVFALYHVEDSAHKGTLQITPKGECLQFRGYHNNLLDVNFSTEALRLLRKHWPKQDTEEAQPNALQLPQEAPRRFLPMEAYGHQPAEEPAVTKTFQLTLENYNAHLDAATSFFRVEYTIRAVPKELLLARLGRNKQLSRNGKVIYNLKPTDPVSTAEITEGKLKSRKARARNKQLAKTLAALQPPPEGMLYVLEKRFTSSSYKRYQRLARRLTEFLEAQKPEHRLATLGKEQAPESAKAVVQLNLPPIVPRFQEFVLAFNTSPEADPRIQMLSVAVLAQLRRERCLDACNLGVLNVR